MNGWDLMIQEKLRSIRILEITLLKGGLGEIYYTAIGEHTGVFFRTMKCTWGSWVDDEGMLKYGFCTTDMLHPYREIQAEISKMSIKEFDTIINDLTIQ